MKLTKDTLNALRKAIDAIGSQREFAARINVDESTISKYLSCKIRTVEHRTWERLYPFIKPYFNKSTQEYFSEASGKDSRYSSETITAQAGIKSASGAEEAILNHPNLTDEQKTELILDMKRKEIETKLQRKAEKGNRHNGQ